MKKEYFLIFSVSLLILAYIIDSISGPVNIVIKNPYQFLSPVFISQFPLTVVGILARSIGVFVGTILLLSLIDKMFFLKASVIFFLAIIFNLFAIQQIATGTRTISIQWILSLAYSGLALLLPTLIYLIRGFLHPIISKQTLQPTTEVDQDEEK